MWRRLFAILSFIAFTKSATDAFSAPCCNKSTSLVNPKAASPAETIPQLEKLLNDCMDSLPTLTPFDKNESGEIAKMIFDSMTTKGRVYHAIDHVFHIADRVSDPIQTLSALFHDIIYYSIDKEFSKEQKKALEGVLVPDKQQLTLAKTATEDPLVDMVVSLYGLTPGDELKVGANEFLSCIVGVRVLSKWLDLELLTEIAACIELTIPFRPVIDGKSAMDRLHDRLVAVCPDKPESWIDSTMHKAAVLTNFDLASFDTKDRDYFLDSTWKLLPEARPSLLGEDCPLSEYLNELHALEGRTKFLLNSVPVIFQSFQHTPSDDEIKRKQQQTQENLLVVDGYARVRLLQLMVLVAFVEASGENPQTLPMKPYLRVEIPGLPHDFDGLMTSSEEEIRTWLVCGRRGCFSWDPAVSELGAYLFDNLGTDGIAEAVKVGKDQEPGSHALLHHLPDSLVCSIASHLDACNEKYSQVPEKLGIDCSSTSS